MLQHMKRTVTKAELKTRVFVVTRGQSKSAEILSVTAQVHKKCILNGSQLVNDPQGDCKWHSSIGHVSLGRLFDSKIGPS